MFKKFLGIVLSAGLAFTALTGCGSAAADQSASTPSAAPAEDQPAADPSAAPAEEPAAADPSAAPAEEPAEASEPAARVDLNIAMPLHASDTATMDGKIMQTLMEKTNTNLTLDLWPADGINERRNTMLADINNLPDMFSITAEQAFIYGAEGVLEPLDELIDQYAPNVKRFMTPENSTSLISPTDGKMYYVPKYDTINQTNDMTFTYRKDILDALGETEPTTMDGWLELFRKVKAAYPDMIILSERNSNVAYFTHAAFDMGRFMFGDFMYGMIGSEMDQHQSVFLPTTQNWKDMLTWYNTVYEEGMLDPAYMTHDTTQWFNEKLAGGLAFACFTQNQGRAQQANDLAAEGGHPEVQWTVAKTVDNYKSGENVIYKVANPWVAEGFAINANISEEKKIAAIKFLDYNFSDECALMYYYGFEGEDYTMENGQPVRTQPFADSEITRKKAGWLYSLPAYAPIEMYSDLSQPVIADHYAKNTIDSVVPLPNISPVGDNVERLNSIMAELMPFTQTARDQFVIGDRSFDEWDAYVAECVAMGSDEGNEIVQGWMDSYYANLN